MSPLIPKPLAPPGCIWSFLQLPLDKTPLQLALGYGGKREMVVMLLEHGAVDTANCGNKMLHKASRAGELTLVRRLLEYGVQVDATDPHNMGDSALDRAARYTALDRAAGMGHLDVVELLLEHGVQVDATDPHGDSALDRAARMGHLDVVELLLEHGASVVRRDKDGDVHSVLLGPLANEEYDVARVLLQHGAPVTFEMVAFSGDSLEAVKLLVEHGVPVDLKHEGKGDTPLIRASREGHLDIVRFLLQHGAQIDAKDDEGCTPLDCARSAGHLDVVKELQSAMACRPSTEQ
eukprot:TRINITY_DN7143_c0_g1_i11.p1 TRINITY_DN7143_c0_g1~~TRINITY_DN7143_c0_g1_i11.p1  ORF type:complete len:292 (+),score=37.35 TRINITY_DN7143_c0_g1_i11:85-960(+)